MKKIIRFATKFISVLFLVSVPYAIGQETKPELPREKQTSLELYVTSRQAYDKWQADPAKVKILDVRTPEELHFVGHPAMAWNIPAFIQTYVWDFDKERFPMKPNPEFITKAKELFSPDDTLLVMCRSGGRSAMAVNQLAEAGFNYVYNITDGMEGDSVKDPESVFHGQRMKNGWKNSGIPWTYKIDPVKMGIPKR